MGFGAGGVGLDFEGGGGVVGGGRVLEDIFKFQISSCFQ